MMKIKEGIETIAEVTDLIYSKDKDNKVIQWG